MSHKLYTRGGDRGETALWDGSRVSKDDPRIELNGTLDEVSSAVGLARSLAPCAVKDDLLKIQEDIQHFMAYVARGAKSVSEPDPSSLEAMLDDLSERYPLGGSFVFPGDSPSGGALHMARTFVRRAERVAMKLLPDGYIGSGAFQYINRLSDLFFALAIKADAETQVDRVVKRVVSAMNGSSGAITLDAALQLLGASRAEAEAIGVPLVLAVCDASGGLVAFQRMDGSLLISLEQAIKKAATAVKLKMNTEELGPLVRSDGPFYGLMNDSSLVAFGGGKLLKRNGVIMGAVGVSGGSVEEDMQVADAAVRQFNELF